MLANNSTASASMFPLNDSPRLLTEEEDGKISTEFLVVFFLFGGLMIAGFVREINKKTSIPYTPMLFVIGMFVGKFAENMGLIGDTVNQIAMINPHGILMIFLPILIFESGFNSDWHTFKKQSGQIFLLAFPCVLFSAIFLLISLKVVLQYDDSYYTWGGAFMFGSILSCTDTIAVLSLLKEVGAPKKFNSLIEGESLLNDGTCMVLFQISSEFAKKVDEAAGLKPAEFDLVQVTKLLLSLTIGGALLGIVFGMVAQFWIRRIHNDPILTVNVTFIICYLTYYVAENVDIGIRVSGIMALVSLGIYLSIFGKTKISAEEKRTVNIFWKYVVYAGESTIFLLAGILVGVKVLKNSTGGVDEEGNIIEPSIQTSDYFRLLGLYICMILSRFGSIACFMSWLRKWGYGLTWKEVYVLAYGGLRGAVGISFAMIVANDDDYSQKLRDIILFDMAGNAVLTLLINGTTTGPLIKTLGLCVTSTVRERVFLNILQDLNEDTIKKINYYKENNYLKMVNWDNVKNLVGCNDLETKIKRLDDELNKREEIEAYTQKIRNKNAIDTKIDELKHSNEFQDNRQSFDSDSTSNNIDENMIVECRNRFLMALKGNYWEIFDRNQCSGNALLLLIDSVNWDLDTEQERMNSWEFLSNYFYNPIYIKVLFWLKSFPIIGSYAGNLLFNQISNIYDVISSYIEAHENAEQLCQEEFPFIGQVMDIIIRESQDNRMSGEEYIKNDLNVSFPEITKQIQTKKATYSLLECQRKIIKKGQLLGQIDEKERDTLMNQIDEKIVSLDNIQPSWKAPPIKNFLENVEFFQHIHKDLLPYLIKESVEMIFEKDMYIIKEGEKAKYFFVITRGSATETTSQSFCTYHEKKEVGSLISPHHLVVPGLRYLTSCMADAVVYVLAFPLSSVQKAIKVNSQIKEYVWKESLRALSQLYYNELRPLGSLDSNSFKKLLPKLQYAKYNKDKTIQCESGGILLKGEASRKELIDVMTNQKLGQDESGHGEAAPQDQTFSAFFVLMPGMAFKLKAEKKCTFLHFSEDCEEIRYMAGHHDYTVRPSTAMMNSQGVLNSPAAVSSVHKKNSFLAPHLSRFGRRSTALNSMNNMEVVVVGQNDKRPESDLSKKKIAEANIKSIKSDDEDSDEGNKPKQN